MVTFQVFVFIRGVVHCYFIKYHFSGWEWYLVLSLSLISRYQGISSFETMTPSAKFLPLHQMPRVTRAHYVTRYGLATCSSSTLPVVPT